MSKTKKHYIRLAKMLSIIKSLKIQILLNTISVYLHNQCHMRSINHNN
jgi:hypothetical protein